MQLPPWDRRLVSCFFGLIVAMGAGPLYCVSAYGPQLRAALRLSQTQLFTITSVGLVLMGFGVLNGRLLDRFGPAVVSLIACVEAAVAFLGVWQIVRGVLDHAPAAIAPLLGVLFGIAGQSANACSGIALVSTKRNYSRTPYLGLLTGIVKFAVPGGAVLFAAIFLGSFEHNLATFMLVVACVTCGITLLAAATVRFHTPKAQAPGEVQKLLSSPFASAQRSSGSVNANFVAPHHASGGAVDMEQGGSPAQQQRSSASSNVLSSLRPVSGSSRAVDNALEVRNSSRDLTNAQPPRPRPLLKDVSSSHMRSITGMEYLSSPLFGMVWAAYAIANGAGMYAISVVGSMTISLGGAASGQAYAVMAIGAANAIGRLVMGPMFDKFPHMPTMALFTAVPCILAVLFVLMAFVATPQWLLPMAAVIGACFGVLNTTSAVVCSEFFGVSNFGFNYGFISLAPGVGGMAFSIFSGVLYDSQVPRGEHVCLGRQCFRVALLTVAACCVGSAVVSGVLLRQQQRRGGRHRVRK